MSYERLSISHVLLTGSMLYVRPRISYERGKFNFDGSTLLLYETKYFVCVNEHSSNENLDTCNNVIVARFKRCVGNYAHNVMTMETFCKTSFEFLLQCASLFAFDIVQTMPHNFLRAIHSKLIRLAPNFPLTHALKYLISITIVIQALYTRAFRETRFCSIWKHSLWLIIQTHSVLTLWEIQLPSAVSYSKWQIN